MATGATRQDLNALHAFVKGFIKRKRHRIACGQPHRQMPVNPEPRRFRLLVDFLQHEVAEMALVGNVIRPTERGWGALLPRSFRVVELDPQWTEQRHFAVFHRQNRARETSQCRGVTGTQELPFAEANQQRCRFACHHQSSWSIGPQHRQGISPLQPGQHRLHSF